MIYRTYENIGPLGSNPFTEHTSLSEAQSVPRTNPHCSRTIVEFPDRSDCAWISTGADWYQDGPNNPWMVASEARPET